MKNAWPMVPLGEVAKPVARPLQVEPGRTYRTLGVKWWGQGAYERETIDGSQTAAKTLSLVRKDDLIINKIWVRHGSTAVVDEKVDGCCGSGEFPTFELNRERLLPGWIHWQTKTRTFWVDCDALSRGTSGKNRIKPELFLTIRIPLPPLAEQRRIVARIEELAAKIAEARRLHDESAQAANTLIPREIASIFQTGRRRGWTDGILGDYVLDAAYGTSEKTNDDSGGTPILRMGNIQDGQLRFTELKYLALSPRERENLLLRPGDILVNRTNSAELVGKCAVFDSEGEFAFASYIIRLRLDRERADPRLVAAYTNSPAGRAYMFNERKQMTGQANVNTKTLRALPIALPPIAEQRRLLTYLDGISKTAESLKRFQVAATAELDALLPSILDKALKGELE